MTKAVMMSIQPQWVEVILNGEKTIEVRKTMPKLETPFKVYVYCTMGKHENTSRGMILKDDDLWKTIDNNVGMGWHYLSDHINDITIRKPLNGKVVAEFTCDWIDYLNVDISMDWIYAQLEQDTCLTFEQMRNYLGQNLGYFWHISDLKIYDKPRELGEFHKKMPCYVQGDYDKLACWECCEFYDRGECDGSGEEPLTRPPQSWYYCEEIEEL